MHFLCFIDEAIKWYTSCLSNGNFRKRIDNIWCFTRFNFGYNISDMPQVVDSELPLYADDSCLIFQHKGVKWKLLNCKLIMHFGVDKTKSILFSPKNRWKTIGQIYISYKDIKIKQLSSGLSRICLGWMPTGESMVMQVCPKLPQK